MASPTSSANAPRGDNQALLELLERLGQNQDRLADLDPRLGRQVQVLLDAPAQTRADDVYRTRLAYAVQDAERLIGPIVPDGSLRRELDGRASTFPGLNNERVASLLQQTPTLEDRGLVDGIRKLALAASKEPGSQDTPAIAQRAGEIENSIRVSGVAPEARSGAPMPPQAEAPSERRQQQREDHAAGFRQQASPAGEIRSSPDVVQPKAESGIKPEESAATQTMPSFRGSQARAQQGPTVADGLIQGAARVLDAVNAADNRATSAAGGTVANLLHAMTSREPLRQANDGDAHTPLRGQFAAFREGIQTRKDDAQLQATERAGAQAVADMKAFASGPASTIMQRVRDASAFDPNGVAGVLDGMRPGGRYQDLGEQMQRERSTSPAFAAAQDKAVASLAAYGTAREAAAAVSQRRGDEAVSGRLERLDAQVGQDASAIPGKTAGRNMLEEVSERVREIIQRAVERITAAFTSRPAASAGPSPTP